MSSPLMPPTGVAQRLSDRVVRVTQDNPGPFTGAGTNTHLVGSEALWILDPGPDDDRHFRLIVDTVGDRQVLGVVPTHHHADHWPLAPRLAEHFGVATLGFGPVGEWRPERSVADGEVLDEGGLHLEAIHTPGHAPDHLCFLFHEEGILFSGDHVMGWSTSVIAPPGGDLKAYLESLDRLDRHPADRMLPAHGLPIDDPADRIDTLRRHRRLRTAQALSALERGLERLPEMVDAIYTGLDPGLHRAAQWSMLAHLVALEAEGRVERIGEGDPIDARWRLAHP